MRRSTAKYRILPRSIQGLSAFCSSLGRTILGHFLTAAALVLSSMKYPIHTHLFPFSLVIIPTVVFSSVSDYLIVGAGTTGCALAARLCALRPDRTVTLLERSSPRNASQQFLVQSPRQMLLSWFTEDLIVAVQSLPNAALNNRTFSVFTGATLGGTSAINGMQFTLPVAKTLDRWRIHGLNVQSGKKYYKRVFDTLRAAIPQGNLRHKYVREYVQAAEMAGFEERDDPLDSSNSRFMTENFLTVDKNGFRRDSCTAYLTPAMHGPCRQNLRLVQDAFVIKIILSKSKPPRAVGVEYTHSEDKQLSRKKFSLARREVIVCAGALGSPQLLQLSGIGPPRVLRKAGVKVRVALPVGRKIQARAGVAVNVEYLGMPLEPSMNSSNVFSQDARRMFGQRRGGVLGIAASCVTGRDKLQGYFAANSNSFPAFVDRHELNAGCFSNVASFGYSRIRSTNPFTAPDLQLAMLESKGEFKRLKSCAQRMVNMYRFFPPGFKITFTDPPNGTISDEWVKKAVFWNGHVTGGCQVGGVLRGDLSVRKTRRLRVIDVSALNKMPLSGGPMASLYAIAEHMAEVLAGVHNASLK